MDYDSNSYVEVIPRPSLNLSDLEEIQCVAPVSGEDEYHFLCKPKAHNRMKCPHCGSYNYYSHGKTQDRFVHDVSMGLTKVFIQLETPRYKCNDCGRTFNHIFDSVAQNGRYTKRLYEQIKKRALNEPFKVVAADYELSINKVKNILLDYGEELEAKRGKVKAPRILGIDEKHITHNMRGVFVDIEKGTLLEMTEDNSQKTVIDTITKMDGYDKIEVVTMDMANAYKPAIEVCLPKAKIVIDKFHVLADHKRRVQEAKKLVVAKCQNDIRELPFGEDRDHKTDLLNQMGKNVYLFKFGAEKLNAKTSRVSLMAELCSEFSDINTLRLLKEGLERVYEASDKEEAEARYQEWLNVLKTADKDIFAPFLSMKGTMERWHTEIFNYFDYRFTNATSEGLNSLVQALNSQGRGYGFQVLRYKSLYHKPTITKPKRFSRTSMVYNLQGQFTKDMFPEKPVITIDDLIECINTNRF